MRCLSRSEGVGGDVTEGHAYAHICSRSQLEPLKHKQPHLVVCFFFSLVCKGGKQTNTSVFLSMELLMENHLKSFASVSPQEEVRLSPGAPPRSPSDDQSPCRVYPCTYMSCIGQRKKKPCLTDGPVFFVFDFYCNRIKKRLLKDTAFQKNKLTLVSSKCFFVWVT